jgi:hypothetical protein
MDTKQLFSLISSPIPNPWRLAVYEPSTCIYLVVATKHLTNLPIYIGNGYIPISTYLDNAYIGTTYISLPTYIGATYIP